MRDRFDTVMGARRGDPDALWLAHPTPAAWARVDELIAAVPGDKLHGVREVLLVLVEHAQLIDRRPAPTALCDRLADRLHELFAGPATTATPGAVARALHAVRLLPDEAAFAQHADRWRQLARAQQRAHLKDEVLRCADPEQTRRAVRAWQATGGPGGLLPAPTLPTPSSMSVAKRPLEHATRTLATELLAGARARTYAADILGTSEQTVSPAQELALRTPDWWSTERLCIHHGMPAERYPAMLNAVREGLRTAVAATP